MSTEHVNNIVDYINPFMRNPKFVGNDFPICPKCKENYIGKCCFFYSEKRIIEKRMDNWTYIKCTTCNDKSANGYYCDYEENGKPHGMYTDNMFPSYAIDIEFYCLKCYENTL